ncbi:hypothetical protein PINS_up000510 [Pythium insidiosum]|nr:hypothetical protein PINS_up000510 [Pythium insidiosum]
MVSTTTTTTTLPSSTSTVSSASTSTSTSASASTSASTRTSSTPASTTWQYGKGKRKRRGWGPYQSVLRERSVDFNLTLDVQHLRQEIQQLETARDALSTQSLLRRHAPSGSLMKVVRAFYRFFRQGFRVDETRRRRPVITAQRQCEFLHSVLDERVDVGNGLVGIPIFIEQIRRYSCNLRFINLQLDGFDIVTAEDATVIIRTSGSMRFQILRETIVGLFPHVMGNHDIVSRLLGADVVAPASLTFYFNAKDKISRYDVDLDFAATFLSLLTNPVHVGILLGDANIAGNAMFGRVEDGVLYDLPDEEDAVERQHDDVSTDVGSTTTRVTTRTMAAASPPPTPVVPTVESDTASPDINAYRASSALTRNAPPPLAWETGNDDDCQAEWDSDFYLDVVDRYFAVFENGWRDDGRQRHFLSEYLSSRVVYEGRAGVAQLLHHWQWLSSTFSGVRWACVDMDSRAVCDRGIVTVVADALYELTVDHRTIPALLPRVPRPGPTSVQALLGATLQCSSRVTFAWREGNRRVLQIDEQMHWDLALEARIVDPETRRLVVSDLVASRREFSAALSARV